MALPNRLKTARMSNATLGSAIDDNVGALEQALADILGSVIDADISAACFEIVAAGLKSVIFQDAAADPAAAGYLRRNGAALRYHNGAAVCDLAPIPSGGTTVMLFRQAAAPTGWTRVVDAGKTDSVIRVLLNNEALADGGSWTISGLSVAAHTHRLPIGTQAGFLVYDDGSTFGTGANFTPVDGLTDGAAGAYGSATPALLSGSATPAISSTGAWRPKCVDVIAASKD